MPKSLPSKPRLDAIDTLRGVALVWMIAYHFCFDLNNFGLARFDFHRDPLWTLQRTAILGIFLFCAGLGQAVASHQMQPWSRFWRRWLQIAGCAVLVSAGSFWMFPDSFIYFGVLHGMAVMLIIARLTAGWGAWLLAPALLALVLPYGAAGLLAQTPWEQVFNAPTLNWLGLITRKPVTEDYVPLLPWIGVLWCGTLVGARWMHEAGFHPAWQAVGPSSALAWLGRHSLWVYMLHQPVLIGALWLLKSASA